MSAAALLLLQAAATATASAPQPLGADYQLVCQVLGAGQANPTSFALDLRRKGNLAHLSLAAGNPWGAVATIGPVRVVQIENASHIRFGFSSNTEAYRLDLTPDQPGGARVGRVRIFRVASDAAAATTVAQGMCWQRPGKALRPARGIGRPDTADAVTPARWKMQKVPERSLQRLCTLMTDDRRLHDFTYTAEFTGNEVAANYVARDATLTGASSGRGAGWQLFLVSPAERLISTTVELAGPAPATYVHVTYEKGGNWIDIARGGAVTAVGQCGDPFASIGAVPVTQGNAP